jgi:hypothetical protein
VALFFVATRGADATKGVVPQQSYYQRFWSDEAKPRMDESALGRLATGGSFVERFEAGLRVGTFRSRLWYGWKRMRNRLARLLPPRLPPVDLRY